MRPTTVVLSTNLMKRLELFDGVQSWVSRVKRRGLSTHPWGAPVFSVMVLDVLLPDPYCLRSPGQKVQQPVAQRRIEPQLVQFMNELLRDDCVECWTEVYEQQSDMRVVLSRCVRAGWRAVAMASSVEQLDLYANWKGFRGRADLMCCMTSRSKHFMRIGVSATGR